MFKNSVIPFYYFALLLFTVGSLSAQISFEAKVSKKRLGLNERLRVDFVMNENGDNFQPPNFSGFRVVSGPQQSVSRSWMNGVRSFSKTYTYFLTPNAKGMITIGQAEMTFSGEVYKTSPISIEVTEAVKTPNDPNNIDYLTDDNIHLVAEISNDRPYLNEGITVIYKLYYRNPINLQDVQEMESPNFSDFWNHIIKIGKAQINPRGSYRGEPYNEVVWRKSVLYPQKTGKVTLEPLTLNLSIGVPSNRRDLFGNRVYQQTQKTVTTGKKIINVKPLPETNQPEGFQGAVGQFDFDLILDKDALKASESFQAKIKVSGKGNLILFELPKLTVPNTLEIYEPERIENVTTKLSGMQGGVEEIYTIVPQFQGKYPIPIVKFSYFDPKEERYKTMDSQKLIVDVFEGPLASNGANNAVDEVSRILVNPTEDSFRFIKLDTALTFINVPNFWLSTRFWGLLLLPFGLIVLALVLKKWVFSRTEDVMNSKQLRAQQLARKYLSSAKKTMGQQVAFYEALERALHNYLKAKLKIETSEMSKPKILSLLEQKKVASQTAKTYISILENCELARYAPGATVQMKQDFDNASDIIAQIDKQL